MFFSLQLAAIRKNGYAMVAPPPSKNSNPLGGVVKAFCKATQKVSVQLCHTNKIVWVNLRDLIVDKEKIQERLLPKQYREPSLSNYIAFVKQFSKDFHLKSNYQAKYITNTVI